MTNTIGKREYNMDIARVLLIFMVIVLHYNNRGMGGALNYAMTGGAKEFIVRFSESLCICAVDSFVILSGYFAVNRSSVLYKKAMYLLVACSFYRTVAYILHANFVIHEFSIRSLIGYLIPSNWFVCLFVSLMLLAPFIDGALSNYDEKKLRELVIIGGILFVAVPTATRLCADIANVDLSGIVTISILGDGEGFNIVTFLYCYIVGAYLRRQKECFAKLSACVCVVNFVLVTIISTGITYFSESSWSYASIFTMLQAILFVLMFSKCPSPNEKIGKVIAMVGACGLGVFVWHTTPFMLYGFWVHFEIYRIAEESIAFYITNLLTATLSMFAISILWVLLCRGAVALVKSFTDHSK